MTTTEAAVAAGGLAERCAELFNAEFNPILRRLGQRAPGAGQQPVDPQDAAARSDVWRTLADLGVLQAAVFGAAEGDLLDVAELMGAALYQSPFFDLVTVADLLAGAGAVDGLLARYATGEQTAAVAIRGDGRDEPDTPAPLRIVEGKVSATRQFVAFAADVDHLVVVGSAMSRMVAAVIPAQQSGVTVRRHDDIGRGDLYAVTLERAEPVNGGLLWIGDTYADVLGRARLRHAAYLAGLCAGALDLTVHRLRERGAFGQPLAKLQALAFRVAGLAARVEAVRALTRRATADADADPRLVGAQAVLLAAELAREVTAEAVHLHGAYGMTEQSDAQLFFRRAVVDAVWLGTPTALRSLAGALLAEHPLTDPEA